MKYEGKRREVKGEKRGKRPSRPYKQNGFRVSRKLCLNLCSRKWPKTKA